MTMAGTSVPMPVTAGEAVAGTRRTRPSRWQYDYLVLRLLYRDITTALELASRDGVRGNVLDVGAGGAPYRALLKRFGYRVTTLDIEAGEGVDVVGTAERTGLAAASFDLVVCTQVLEHTRSPWLAMREFNRILRPGGHVVVSVPHVWFHHPHPADYWRMTEEGVAALCEEGGVVPVMLASQGSSAATFFQVANFLAYGLVGRAGAPLYAIVNLLGDVANATVRDRRFAMNHVCLARKPAQDDRAAPVTTTTP